MPINVIEKEQENVIRLPKVRRYDLYETEIRPIGIFFRETTGSFNQAGSLAEADDIDIKEIVQLDI